MAKTIDQLISEADDLINAKVAAAKSRPAQPSAEIQKLAEELLSSVPPEDHREKVATESESTLSGIAKIAEAVAITDTLLNMPTFIKMATLEAKCLEAGHSSEQVQAFFEKNAAAFNRQSVLESMPWLFR